MPTSTNKLDTTEDVTLKDGTEARVATDVTTDNYQDTVVRHTQDDEEHGQCRTSADDVIETTLDGDQVIRMPPPDMTSTPRPDVTSTSLLPVKPGVMDILVIGGFVAEDEEITYRELHYCSTYYINYFLMRLYIEKFRSNPVMNEADRKVAK